MIRAFVRWCVMAAVAAAVAGVVCAVGTVLLWHPMWGLAVAVALATIVAVTSLVAVDRLHPTNCDKGGES